MTNEEMIEWAKLEPASDFIWHAQKENLERLIWIARNQERKRLWDYVRRLAEFESDVSALESYRPSMKGKK